VIGVPLIVEARRATGDQGWLFLITTSSGRGPTASEIPLWTPSLACCSWGVQHRGRGLLQSGGGGRARVNGSYAWTLPHTVLSALRAENGTVAAFARHGFYALDIGEPRRSSPHLHCQIADNPAVPLPYGKAIGRAVPGRTCLLGMRSQGATDIIYRLERDGSCSVLERRILLFRMRFALVPTGSSSYFCDTWRVSDLAFLV